MDYLDIIDTQYPQHKYRYISELIDGNYKMILARKMQKAQNKQFKIRR